MVGGISFLIIIDSGTSHNFITRELVDSLVLPLTQTREFKVNLGNGSHRTSHGRCRGLIVTIHRYRMVVDAYVLDLGGIDLILGVECLETLGVTRTDWKKKAMSIEQAR